MSKGLKVLCQLNRDFNKPLIEDSVFDTSADLLQYLNSEERYAGMIVSCVETEKAYILNSTEDAWIELGAGGGSGLNVSKEIVQNAHGFVKGDIVRNNGTSYVKSVASTPLAAEVDGIVIEVKDANTFSITSITGAEISIANIKDADGNDLTANTVYFLSETTPGKLSKTTPTQIGSINKNILKTLDTTVAIFVNGRGVEIGIENIDSPLGGDISRTITLNSHGFNNDFIYYNGSTWVKALADVSENVATHFAISVDNNSFKAYSCGDVDVVNMTDDTGASLVNGEYYFLSQTVPGKVTPLSPISGVTQSVLKANESGKASIMIEEPFVSGGITNSLVKRDETYIVEKKILQSVFGTTSYSPQYLLKIANKLHITLSNSFGYIYDESSDSYVSVPGASSAVTLSDKIICKTYWSYGENIYKFDLNFNNGIKFTDSDFVNLFTADTTHVYYTTTAAPGVLNKDDISTMTHTTFSLSDICFLAVDSTHLYVLRNRVVEKRDKITYSISSQSETLDSYAGEMISSGDYLYVMTQNTIYKIAKNTMTTVDTISIRRLSNTSRRKLDDGDKYIYHSNIEQRVSNGMSFLIIYKIDKASFKIVAQFMRIVNYDKENAIGVVEKDDNNFYTILGYCVVELTTINNIMEGI